MKIKCAAIRTKSGQIFEGKNHAVCYLALKEAGVSRLDSRNCAQGFVTDDGVFVDRYEAAKIAFKAGQTKKQEDILFSEDLTDGWFWRKNMEQYIIQNIKTNLYLMGFKGNKPLWTEDAVEAASYEQKTVLSLKRRLDNLYSPAQKIKIIKK